MCRNCRVIKVTDFVFYSQLAVDLSCNIVITVTCFIAFILEVFLIFKCRYLYINSRFICILLCTYLLQSSMLYVDGVCCMRLVAAAQLCSTLPDQDLYSGENPLIEMVVFIFTANHGSQWHCTTFLQRRPAYPWT